MNPQTGASNGTRKGPIAVEDRTLSHGVPSEPVLGKLPLARLVPMDVHAMLEYGNYLGIGGCALTTDCPRARIASIALAAMGTGTAAMTDYRLAIARVIPIETHEKLDHMWGLTAIALPFALGYWKTAPKVAMAHVIAGASNILMSLFTDYRAYKKRRARK